MREGRGLRVARWLVLGGLTIFTGVPLLTMLITSFRSPTSVRAAFEWLPSELTLRGYGDMWSTIPFGRYLANSLFVATVSAAVVVIVAIPAGYTLARFRFRGRGWVAAGILSAQLVPGVLFLVPLFAIFAAVDDAVGIQLIGSYPGLIITTVALCLPVGAWLLSRYFAAVPVDVEQAAQLDGAGPIAVLCRIAIPIARPGIIAVGVLAFTLSWGEVLFTSVLSTAGSRTVAVGLAEYTTGPAPQWNTVMAAAITASVPAVLAFGYLLRIWNPVGKRGH